MISQPIDFREYSETDKPAIAPRENTNHLSHRNRARNITYGVHIALSTVHTFREDRQLNDRDICDAVMELARYWEGTMLADHVSRDSCDACCVLNGINLVHWLLIHPHQRIVIGGDRL